MLKLTKLLLLPALVGLLAAGLIIALMDTRSSPEPSDDGWADAVASAAPAVVNIYSSKIVTPPICELPRYREWCELYRDNSNARTQSSLGSGVVVNPAGFILTNNHVIQGADEILVAFANGQATTASLVGTDPETDLAVIQVPLAPDAPGLATLSIGDSEAVRVGEIALAIGNPFGIGQTVSQGIVSAKGRAGVSASPYDDFLQTDAAINPGNSGGALIDADGRLIGINTMIFSRSGGSQGIGFAIPVNLAMSILQQIIDNGRVRRGWLGIELGATNDGRLAVTLVLPRSPAHMAGMQPGDLIRSLDGRPMSSVATFTRDIGNTPPGEMLRIGIERQGQLLELKVTAGERSR